MAGGQQIAVEQGSLGDSRNIPLVGSQADFAAGIIGYSTETYEALLGSESVLDEGDLGSARLVPLRSRKIGGGAAFAALTGQQITSVNGILDRLVGPQLLGIPLSVGQGVFGKQRSRLLTGSAATASAGTVGTSSQQEVTWNGAQPHVINVPAFTLGTSGSYDLTLQTTNYSVQLHDIQLDSALPAEYAITADGLISYGGGGSVGNASRTATIVDSAEADWIARSTVGVNGVFRSYLFESAAAVNAYRWTNGVGHDPNPAGGSMGSYCRWNATDGILGRGCLELEAHPTSNTTTYFWFPFDPSFVPPAPPNVWNGAGNNFGPGQGFYIQLRFKTNCEGQGSTGGGGRKQFSASRLEASYTYQEMVAQDTLYRGVMHGYQGYGPGSAYQGIETTVPPSDFNLEPGSTYAVAPGYCSYQAVQGGNRANCWLAGSNVWKTYLMYVLPSTEQTANGRWTLYGWEPGMSDYAVIWDKQNFYMRYSGAQQAFNALLLWIYETGRTSGPSNQKQWYDQVILSTQFIPRPQV